MKLSRATGAKKILIWFHLLFYLPICLSVMPLTRKTFIWFQIMSCVFLLTIILGEATETLVQLWFLKPNFYPVSFQGWRTCQDGVCRWWIGEWVGVPWTHSDDVGLNSAIARILRRYLVICNYRHLQKGDYVLLDTHKYSSKQTAHEWQHGFYKGS